MGNEGLAQYGAIGIIAAMALLAVRVLFAREVKAHDADRERADRLEAELRALNDLVRTQYIQTITESSKVIAEALVEIQGRRRMRDRP